LRIQVTLTEREVQAILDVIDDWEMAKRYCSEEWEKDRPLIHSTYNKLRKALKK